MDTDAGTKVRVVGIGKLPPLEGIRYPKTADPLPAPTEHRPVYTEVSRSFVDTPVYQGANLSPGHCLDGPVIIEEATTTVVIGSNEQVTIDDYDNYIVVFTA